MFERIGRGWNIVKASWTVVKRYPRLLLFPVFSGIAAVAVIAALALPVSATHSDYIWHVADNLRARDPVAYVLLFAFYLAGACIVIFFNAAMIFCALQCFAGKEPSVRVGLAAAVGRLPQILAWAFVAAAVGLILDVLLDLLKGRLGFIGNLLGNLGEVAWGAVNYLVVPVVVVDGVGPIRAVKRSSSILRRTWGEAATGEAGLSLISYVLFLPIAVLVVAVGFVGGLSITAIAAILIAYGLALAVAFSALDTIFRAGTYIYATTGTAPGNLDPDLLQTSFERREPRDGSPRAPPESIQSPGARSNDWVRRCPTSHAVVGVPRRRKDHRNSLT